LVRLIRGQVPTSEPQRAWSGSLTGAEPRKKQQQRRLTEPQQAELVERYQSGDWMAELATRFGIDRRTVSAILKRHGVPSHPRGLSTGHIQRAVLMYAQGDSLAVIGTKLGVNGRTIHKLLLQQGVVMRDAHGRQRITGEVVRHSVTVASDQS
jgi:DNA-binding CsgD family transcriptional regulator